MTSLLTYRKSSGSVKSSPHTPPAYVKRFLGLGGSLPSTSFVGSAHAVVVVLIASLTFFMLRTRRELDPHIICNNEICKATGAQCGHRLWFWQWCC